MAITDEIPRSRITLTYRTTVRGEPEEVELPFRVLIMGDLSKKKKEDGKPDPRGSLDKRPIRKLDGKNLNQVMKDMEMTLKLQGVTNKINPTAGGATFDVTLPITSMKAFQPAEIATKVPRIQALLLLRKLLIEAQSKFDNQPKFRASLREAAKSADSIQGVVSELATFTTYKVPGAKLKIEVAAAKAALPDDLKSKIEVWRGKVTRETEALGVDQQQVEEWEKIEEEDHDTEVRLKPGRYKVRVTAPGKVDFTGSENVEHDTVKTITVTPFADRT